MAYRREDIERVRGAINLAELIGEVTSVKRTGRSVMAICPFHQEKTPSMSVDAARGLYHCFGCGESGDLFRFVQETQGVGFTDALEMLARRAGVILQEDPEAAKRRGRREALTDSVRLAVDFYHERLRIGDDAKAARGYLRGRGYDADVVAQFQIGWAPDTWDSLTSHLKAKDISDEVLTAAGLATRSRRGTLIDRFRNRIVFPIYDLRGDPVGFGARLLEGEGPKYLNSAEGPLYHKAQLLYGLNWAKSDIVRAGYSIVVEGYTDVIALHQAGLPLAVATCGTALGSEHFDLLRRFADRVVLAFDSDAAGAMASLRGLEATAALELDIRVAELPEGADPADLVSAGELDSLRKAVDSSVPLVQFAIDAAIGRHQLGEPEERVRAVRAAAEVLQAHPDGMVRSQYVGYISRHTGVDQADVAKAVGSSGRSRHVAQRSDGDEPVDSGQLKAERELLRALLANHPDIGQLDLDAAAFTEPLHGEAFARLLPMVTSLDRGDALDLGALYGSADTAEARLVRRLAVDDRPIPHPGEVAQRLKVGAVERRIKEMRRDLQSLDPDGPEYSNRFGELIALEKERRHLGGHS